MKIAQSFTVACAPDDVWAFFQDVPAVAACLPGAELLESRPDGTQRGKVAASLGPFKAAFEGEAKISTDPTTRSGHVVGRGVDKRGGSHSSIALDYKLSAAGGATRVDLDLDLILSGPIAQFGRTGLVTETASVLVADFARNLEARISKPGAARPPVPAVPNEINSVALVVAVLRSWLKRIFGLA